MTRRPGLTFSHIGFHPTDVDRQADLYRACAISPRGDGGTLPGPNAPLRLIFLSRHPDERHQIVLVSGRLAADADRLLAPRAGLVTLWGVQEAIRMFFPDIADTFSGTDRAGVVNDNPCEKSTSHRFHGIEVRSNRASGAIQE
jgi:hypothetical protein